MTQLESITNLGVNCLDMKPLLNSGVDTFTLSIDDSSNSLDWVNGQTIVHDVDQADVTVGNSYSRMYDLVYYHEDIASYIGNQISITLEIIASCNEPVDGVLIESSDASIDLIYTANSQDVDSFNIQIDPWT